MMRGETRIDELSEIFPDLFSSIPFSNTEAALSILGKTLEAFAESLIVDFLPKCQQPIRRRSLPEFHAIHLALPGFDS
jgi:hypothetical protein